MLCKSVSFNLGFAIGIVRVPGKHSSFLKSEMHALQKDPLRNRMPKLFKRRWKFWKKELVPLHVVASCCNVAGTNFLTRSLET